MNTITRRELMKAYDAITKASERIERLMEPGAERATAWMELIEARETLRLALVDGVDIKLKEAA
jgi:hypothetical protein